MFSLAVSLLLSGPINVPVVWTGEYSKVTQASVRVVETPAEWLSVWHAHIGKADVLPTTLKQSILTPNGYPYRTPVEIPEVDFSKHAVLVRFGGTSGHAGYDVKESRLDRDTLNLKIQPRWYSTGGGRRTAPPRASTPFGFFLVPKGFKGVKVEEGFLEDKRNPIEWKTIFEKQL